MKILTVIGARPQFVKAAVVSRIINSYPEIEEVIIHTGQHYDQNMSDVFFNEMQIPKPKYNLCINGLSHGAMTGQMLERIEEVLKIEKPDWVLVYGDTNSTLAGALASKKLDIKVAHVEAGLRSYNMKMPEEINRILTDRLSNILFCPSQTAVKNLKKEGFDNFDCNIINVGDVMIDATVFYGSKAKKPIEQIPEFFNLCTIHRAENTDNPSRLISIINALDSISHQNPVILPLHPRTKIKLAEYGYKFDNSKINFINPVGYLQMIWLLKNCNLVLTDSGGLQKEAYFFKKYCITLRDETEWIELVNNNINFLVGADKCLIISKFNDIVNKKSDSFPINLFGNGNAGDEIIKTLFSQS